ncbi:MAG: hypothetical protein CL840_01690 [Crocinitomicaceae bacterium]|nr:hypothetical protein [Crocinitomicaceae bacterium]|tara:strand:+ start:1549 stop:2112 length:564 start_codon:yes stop_codon:yes gene_type:complete
MKNRKANKLVVPYYLMIIPLIAVVGLFYLPYKMFSSLDSDRENKEQRFDKKPILVNKEPQELAGSTLWCSSRILLKTSSQLDSLNINLVDSFLSTFHESCRNNVEYSEWSNELLFKVLIRNPEMVLIVLSTNPNISYNEIIHELESPIHDQINLGEIILKIEGIQQNENNNWKSPIVKALKKANENQ